jgi:hypothetical protein
MPVRCPAKYAKRYPEVPGGGIAQGDRCIPRSAEELWCTPRFLTRRGGTVYLLLMNIVLLSALAVMLVAGCSIAPLTPTTEVGPDRGVVVLRLGTNMAPAGFFAGYDKLHIVSDTGIYELSRTAVGGSVSPAHLAPSRSRRDT